MSAKFTDKQLADLLAGIADGLPIGALAGTVREYDADTCKLLERLEHWWNYPGERPTSYRLRQSVAVAIRARFHDQDEAEQKAARRKGRKLRRGGVDWTWNAGADFAEAARAAKGE